MSEIDGYCRELANWLRWQRRPVTRLEAARGLRVDRSVVDYHWPHMVRHGLVMPAPRTALARGAQLWQPGGTQPPAEWACPLHRQLMPVVSLRFFIEPEDGDIRVVVVYRCIYLGCRAEVTEEHGGKAADVPLDGGVVQIKHALEPRD